jgi:hypothetical protein
MLFRNLSDIVLKRSLLSIVHIINIYFFFLLQITDIYTKTYRNRLKVVAMGFNVKSQRLVASRGPLTSRQKYAALNPCHHLFGIFQFLFSLMLGVSDRRRRHVVSSLRLFPVTYLIGRISIEALLYAYIFGIM